MNATVEAATKHLFMGGPLHGQVRAANTSTCEVPSSRGTVVYRRELFVHLLTQRRFYIYVHGEKPESWTVTQKLRAAGLFDN